jgi:multidrug efflux pump subunit AcrA (membrane-fusion protein)
MFARVRVPSTTPYAAVLLPDTAIGTEQARKFVLTVNADNTVVSKFVTLGQTTPDGLRVIKDGIGPDDQIIVNGLMRARPGQKVTPQEQIATPPAQGAAQQKS